MGQPSGRRRHGRRSKQQDLRQQNALCRTLTWAGRHLTAASSNSRVEPDPRAPRPQRRPRRPPAGVV